MQIFLYCCFVLLSLHVSNKIQNVWPISNSLTITLQVLNKKYYKNPCHNFSKSCTLSDSLVAESFPFDFVVFVYFRKRKEKTNVIFTGHFHDIENQHGKRST